jgi:predicted acylesterase/phospholipase RssA
MNSIIKEREPEIVEENIEEPPKIKHIVISGGGTSGFTAYGILRESEIQGLWNKNDIQSYYGTSIGAILSVMFSLNFEWDVLDDYIIKRPWQHVFKMDMYSIINSIQKIGIFNIQAIESVFEPLFKAKDYDMNITLKEFYENTGIEIHLFATEFNETVLVDLSYKTHPDWKVIEAVYCSCCLPLMFAPYLKEDKIYFDGGTFSNYPLNQCCENVMNYDEILGIKSVTQTIARELHENSNLFDYIVILLKKVICKLGKTEKATIKNEFIIETNIVSIYDELYMALSNSEMRTQLIEKGKTIWEETRINDPI